MKGVRKVGNKISFALAGLGSRGKEVYAQAIAAHPEKMEITAIADITSFWKNRFRLIWMNAAGL